MIASRLSVSSPQVGQVASPLIIRSEWVYASSPKFSS
jgi:hypothetical protein